MKIILSNFRSHQDVEVIIPNRGATLLSGPSGSGKSTILNAIEFVLYGKLQRCFTFGTRKCSVTLEYDGYCVNRYPGKSKSPITQITIYRQKGPELLRVTCNEFIHEDADAQAVIDSIFGPEELFGVTSYLRQGQRCQLLRGTNAEKMHQIEQLTFRDHNIASIKKALSDRAKLVTEDFKRQETLLSAATDELSRFDKRHPGVDQKTKAEEVGDVESKLQELTKILSQHQEQERELYAENLARTKARKEEEERKKKLDKVKDEVRVMQETAAYKGLIPDDVFKSVDRDTSSHLKAFTAHISTLGDRHASLLAESKTARLAEEYANLSKKTKTDPASLQTEIDELKRELENPEDEDPIKVTLTDEYLGKVLVAGEKRIEKLTHLSSHMGELEIEDVDDIKAEEEKEEKKLESLQEQEEVLKKTYLECPECHANLVLVGEKLEKSSGDAPEKGKKEKELKEVRAKIKTSRTRLETLRETSKFVAGMKKTETENFKSYSIRGTTAAVEKYRELREKLAAQGEAKRVQEREKKLSELLGPAMGPGRTVTEVTKEIAKTKEQIATFEAARDKFVGLLAKHRELSKTVEVKHSLDSEIAEVKKKVTSLQEQVDGLKLVKANNILVVQKTEIQKRIAELEEKRVKAERELGIVLRLKDKAVEAENFALDETVESLNAEIATQLEILFTDPISVRIETTKQLKTTKATKNVLNIAIVYKGEEYSKISQLSGGEGDRVSLAIALALNKFSNSPFLFLDETLSSFDADLFDDVVPALKEYASHTPVLVIHHGNATGCFDSEIPLQ